ncbi:FadR/GntR family transcriptional regulator [Aggregatilinea lenta]|uniref:FadR/GntR family transcriptional regulator n=1 Tax=Aggregatilinea lenta TaxID=913108 RepID=UPI000E5BBEA0|nr:FadR/GntR family transcriptional regulator [Aggregatilinea lenta]
MDANLRRPVLSETVRKHIQRYILEKKLKPGDSLPPEAQLAADLGVGRSSIREAMKSLQSLGIVRVQRGEGFFVRKWNLDPVLETLSYGICFNPAAFRELLQIRIWLESATIGEVVARITPREIAELDTIMQAWKARSDSKAAFADLDEQFHNVLYQTLENDTFASLLRVFWRAFETVNADLAGDADLEIEFQAHLAIFEAIKRRDAVLAQEKLLASFTNLEVRLHGTSC